MSYFIIINARIVDVAIGNTIHCIPNKQWIKQNSIAFALDVKRLKRTLGIIR
jgi:plasmid rolling circle replication initiator protein Rep